jgi:hypothetical protein
MTMAKKLIIEIEDIGNKGECVAAIRKLFAAVKDRHGREKALRLWLGDTEGPRPDQRERSRLRCACMSFDKDDLRLILEYYAMAKPNKEKLSRDLAKKNESLPEEKRYPVKSAENPAGAILQQIKEALRFDGEACRIIGEAPEYLRQEALKGIENNSRRLYSFRPPRANLEKKIKKKPKLPRRRFITIRQREAT